MKRYSITVNNNIAPYFKDGELAGYFKHGPTTTTLNIEDVPNPGEKDNEDPT